MASHLFKVTWSNARLSDVANPLKMNEVLLLNVRRDFPQILANYFRVGRKQDDLVLALHQMIEDALAVLDVKPPERRIHYHREAAPRD